MSLSRVSSIDGLQMGREGTRASISHRRMSFNPVSDWMPELQKRPSVSSTYTREEVSKGKRIGELGCTRHHLDSPSTSTDTVQFR
jgi:hypothetical protein